MIALSEIQTEINSIRGKIGMAGRYDWPESEKAVLVDRLNYLFACRTAFELKKLMADLNEHQIGTIRDIFKSGVE